MFIVENPVIYALSALFLCMLLVVTYFFIFAAIFFIVEWGMIKIIRPIIKLVRLVGYYND